MSGTDPKGWGDKFLSLCLSMLVGTIALYLVVSLLKAIWVWLAVVAGIAALAWFGIVVYRATKNHW